MAKDEVVVEEMQGGGYQHQLGLTRICENNSVGSSVGTGSAMGTGGTIATYSASPMEAVTASDVLVRQYNPTRICEDNTFSSASATTSGTTGSTITTTDTPGLNKYNVSRICENNIMTSRGATAFLDSLRSSTSAALISTTSTDVGAVYDFPKMSYDSTIKSRVITDTSDALGTSRLISSEYNPYIRKNSGSGLVELTSSSLGTGITSTDVGTLGMRTTAIGLRSSPVKTITTSAVISSPRVALSGRELGKVGNIFDAEFRSGTSNVGSIGRAEPFIASIRSGTSTGGTNSDVGLTRRVEPFSLRSPVRSLTGSSGVTTAGLGIVTASGVSGQTSTVTGQRTNGFSVGRGVLPVTIAVTATTIGSGVRMSDNKPIGW